MFTLKLFYRREDGSLVTKIEACTHVEWREFKDEEVQNGNGRAGELWIIGNSSPGDRCVMIGEITEKRRGEGNWYGWGLLENWEGNTTQHFRPASYG